MTQQSTYDPHNPHPLSQMRTELGWEGKYDEYGNRLEGAIAAYQYPAPGKYIACVKVVDTFGCDTSITVEVEV
jgi:hypothetical protein